VKPYGSLKSGLNPALFSAHAEPGFRSSMHASRGNVGRRTHAGGERLDEVRLGSRTLQPHRQLLVNGRREPIGKRALDIISVLAEARGQIVTKDELLEAVWPGVIVEENALQVHVVALRKALGPEADRLKTIRGVGYQLDIGGEAGISREPSAKEGVERPPSPSPAPVSTPVATTPRLAMALPRVPRVHVIVIASVAALLALVGAWWFAGPSIGLRSPERIPVVVRAFTVRGTDDPSEAELASGITDELIVRLRRLDGLRIATADAGRSTPGAAFRNAYTIDGSIGQNGNEVRITVRLTRPSGEVLWSQSFDRPIADLFSVQETVAATIADTLSVSLDVGTNATEHGGTNNPEAFAAYLQYRPHALDPDQTEAVRYLEHALALDPTYIKALSGLAGSYASQAARAPTEAQALALLAKADETAARAIAANPRLWMGYVSRGWIYSIRKDFRSAHRSFQQAAQLDSGLDPELRVALANYSLGLGRTRDALALLSSNDMVDPTRQYDPTRIGALLQGGRHKEAIDLFEQIAAIDPSSVRGPATGNVFWAHLVSGGEAEALEFADSHLPALATRLREFKADKALPEMSREELRQWARMRYGDGGNLDLAVAAAFASYYGHSELAIELLRLSDERVGGFAHAVIWNPVMVSARKTERFEQLVTDLGLVQFWRERSLWPDFCRPVGGTKIDCN
jgi:DNA-binding winged helix-turn-helix (wHTH) protein/TolB-like protein/tetratricopeptide (TPR) repeat protein